MLFPTAVLLSGLLLAAGYSCPNRLYRAQRLNVSQYLCSRSQIYRMLFNNSGQVQINEAFPSNTSYRPPPQMLFSTNTTSPSPSHVTFTDAGDFVAVGMDGAVYWRAGVSSADFLELQDTGVAVLFAKNASTIRMLWKSLSMYSLRIVGGTNDSVGRLEFYFSNIWGAVGTYTFDSVDADVACRTLGFDTGNVTTNIYGQSTGQTWMDQMSCIGKETVFQECPFGHYLNNKYWWGMVYYPSHTYDVAISCQGNSSLSVLPPIAHVCSDRLYVGQTLALGESLCAGPNGEYSLRFTNKRLDTVLELWYKSEWKWSIGMVSATIDGATVRLDGDGVMRIGNGTGLLYSLFSNTTANASFVELQDNGVVRVVSSNGTTGWRKAPEDNCYTMTRKTYFLEYSKNLASGIKSPLDCMAYCNGYPLAKTIAYLEIGNNCFCLRGYPWDVGTRNTTYYEKTPGCSSGPGCYQNYTYDRWEFESQLAAILPQTNVSACMAYCDTIANCVAAYFVAPNCYLNWKRINESWDMAFTTNYFKKTPCTPVDPSQVPLLPVKACPTKLLAGSLLLPQQYLCSPNGQHVLTVEKDGRLLIDGGKWMSNDATNRSGYLQYTANNQLLLRLDDGSTPWKVESRSTRNPSAGYLALSDGGILQMFNSTGQLIWDQQNGFHISLTIIDGPFLTNVSPLVDGSALTCVSRVQMVRFRVSNATLSTTWGVVMTGHSMQCGNASAVGSLSFLLAYDTVIGDMKTSSKYDSCILLTAAAQECHFQCLCQRSLCDMLVLRYNGCSDAPGDICDVALE